MISEGRRKYQAESKYSIQQERKICRDISSFLNEKNKIFLMTKAECLPMDLIFLPFE